MPDPTATDPLPPLALNDVVAELAATPGDLLPAILARFAADRAGVDRRYPHPLSLNRDAHRRRFLTSWRAISPSIPPATRADRIDLILFQNLLERELDRLGRDEAARDEMAPLLPFAPALVQLHDDWRDHVDLDARAAAHTLHDALGQLLLVDADVDARDGAARGVPAAVAFRAAQAVNTLQTHLNLWREFYAGFDPNFDFWCDAPFTALDSALTRYAEKLKTDLADAADSGKIIGDPIGRDALLAELAASFVPFTPEELIEKADAERLWCLEELRKASAEMGLGGDTRAAIEAVKRGYVGPGEQPALVRELAHEAISFVEEHALITVPELARGGWRMSMISAERQKVSPFFLGGEVIQVSAPHESMSHERKSMSARGNNPAFSRATVQHELIPGHYMQSWAQERYRSYRRLFWTAFWVEGWTLHWEFLLWELGFPQTPQQKVGMLFWRLHRCARVLFSFRFHLGEWTPEQCVDLLVNEVGHEPENAEAEVRRSFSGAYDPLYQAAYLIGGMQVHALYKECLDAGQTPREFHDAFLKENTIPINAVRASLLNHETPDLAWRFQTNG